MAGDEKGQEIAGNEEEFIERTKRKQYNLKKIR